MLRVVGTLLMVLGALSANQAPVLAPPGQQVGSDLQVSSYSGPGLKIFGVDTLMVSMINIRDYQSNGPTPIRLWAVPQVEGIYASLFSRNPNDLRWNFYDWTTFSWVASDTGYNAYEPAGYGQLFVNFYSNSYEYYPVFTGHEYLSGNYYPDLWWPALLSFEPFYWNGNYVHVSGWSQYQLWPRIGITESGYLHQITTNYNTYNIWYNRIEDMENPSWGTPVEVETDGNGPWYAFNVDPYGKTLVLTYTRTSLDNHLIMLIDTLEGDMFYLGNPIEIDLSSSLYPIDTLSFAFVGEGVPFVDKDGNIHHVLFGNSGLTWLPVHIWHFFYDVREDTVNWSLIDVVSGESYYPIGINTVGAGRGQIGQNPENGDLFVIWEQFIQEPGRFVVNSTGDTFAPVAIKMGMSTDNGLTWDVMTLLESDTDFGNHWLRFPLMSPRVFSLIENDTLYDRVVWGVHEDYDPGFTWQGQGTDTTQVLWVGIKDFSLGPPTSLEERRTSPFLVSFDHFPSPATRELSISFSISQRSFIALEVFDASGRMVKELLRGELEGGDHRVTWDLRNEEGDRVASGTYFYVIQTPNKSFTGKVLVLR